MENLQIVADIILNQQSINQIKDKSAIQQIQKLMLEGTSMGGARPKAIVESDNQLWIAKFSTNQDRWNQPLVEHGLLKLAKKCGLTVSESKIVSVANKDVLFVKRFDREKAKESYYRYRMISALTLLQLDDDITARENWSYLLLADEIRRVSSAPKKDLKELFARMCFNAMVSNSDDHPRNHALIAKNQNWRLSPAYDLTPTPTVSQERLLAMSCGLQGRIATKENLLSACERFMLPQEEAENIIHDMEKIIKKEWHVCLKRVGVSEKDCDYIKNAFLYKGFSV